VLLGPREARERELYDLAAVALLRSGDAGLVAAFSMRVMRATSTTSNARALWQTASTRPLPNFSQGRKSAYAARIRAHGSGPPSRRSA
jgi:hypothetical protein